MNCTKRTSDSDLINHCHFTALACTALHWPTQHCTTLAYSTLPCTALHCTALHKPFYQATESSLVHSVFIHYSLCIKPRFMKPLLFSSIANTNTECSGRKLISSNGKTKGIAVFFREKKIYIFKIFRFFAEEKNDFFRFF